MWAIGCIELSLCLFVGSQYFDLFLSSWLTNSFNSELHYLLTLLLKEVLFDLTSKKKTPLRNESVLTQ